MEETNKATGSNSGCTCSCGGELNVIYTCSGAADVGEITDRAARKMMAEGAGKMSCLAGIGGRVSLLMATAEAASKILAIDGCPQDCAKKTLDCAGIENYRHLRVTDLGMIKGKSPVTDDRIEAVASKGKELLSS